MRRVLVVAACALVLAGIGLVAFLGVRPAAPVVGTPAPAPSPAVPGGDPPAPVPSPAQPPADAAAAAGAAVEARVKMRDFEVSAPKAKPRDGTDPVLKQVENAKMAAGRTMADRRSEPPACPASMLPAFRWPDPPLPTNSTQIARTYLSAAGEPEPATLGDVQKRLNRLVQAAGYRVPSILGAGCNGFALVLDLERLRDDGRRLDGADGFAGPGQRQAFSILDILVELIRAEPGYYRVIVIVVSDQGRMASTARASAAQLRALADAGRSTLPAGLGERAFDERYVVEALVYEFEKNPRSETAELRKPEGRLAATTHLAQARLIDLARPAR